MDYLEGTSLAEFLQREGPLSPATALPIIEQIANAVDYAHRQGVLHRDLKPANIFLVNDTSGHPIVRVLDFGLAHLIQNPDRMRVAPEASILKARPNSLVSQDHIETLPLEGKVTGISQSDFSKASTLPISVQNSALETIPDDTNPNDVVGTSGYMAPEVVNQVGAGTSVDVYAFGMTVYEMLAGRLPFTGPISEVLSLQVSTPPPPPSTLNPSIPGALDDAILAPLAKNPADRPASLRSAVDGVRRSIEWQAYQIWREREVPGECQVLQVIQA
jgi:serine/threonine-protein kinase